MTGSSQCGFILRPTHKYLAEVLSPEQLGNLWILILKYLEDDSATLEYKTEVEKLAFLSIKTQIDKDKEQYKKRCKLNRVNGKKGGRPPSKPSEPETDGF
jgi:hypothetical protein